MNDGQQFVFYPGDTADIIQQTITRLDHDKIVARIWARDHTVWSPYPDEILNRLGWLTIADTMRPLLDDISSLAEAVRNDGIRHVVVLGMGGASLAAEVFQAAFEDTLPGIPITVMDSTHPAAIQRLHRTLNLAETLFIFSMKKWALETYSLFKYFYNALEDTVGHEQASQHVIAITDVGTWVAPYAERMGFRHIIYNDPYVGGRYAALSHVGLFPAALHGVDIHTLLARAHDAQTRCRHPGIAPDENTGAWLGAVIGGLAADGRDKLTILASESLESWLVWLEQLVAESTGKSGRGILPVIELATTDPSAYGRDRLFVILEDRRSDNHVLDKTRTALIAAGHPVIHAQVRDAYDLGAQFVYWAFAVATAGHVLGVQPFDQPNVEATKIATGRLLEQYQALGQLPELMPITQGKGLTAFGNENGESLADVVSAFFSQARAGDYIAVHAYLAPDSQTTRQLRQLQQRLERASGCATTFGYGPRFLHSTGQLHKGDSGRGHFIQITADAEIDLPVPQAAGSVQSDYTFGTLLAAQALGDWNALQKLGRHVIRLHIHGAVQQGLGSLLDFI